jgi:hypothetical protein
MDTTRGGVVINVTQLGMLPATTVTCLLDVLADAMLAQVLWE